jgi:PPK2 family polyphosphate:nucleotide phosphotransferase
MCRSITFAPGKKVKLADIDPGGVQGDWTKESAAERVKENSLVTQGLADILYAENRHAVLLVLQGMDTSGKDGAIRTVMSGINPQSCQVTSFKVPSSEELDHDFLWRIHLATPRRGNIGVFNRSHYEDVLVVRVHNLVPEKEWKSRYQRINEFEELLVDGGVTFIKCFLHISKDEQRKRLQARIDDPLKRWKFALGDIEERKLWPKYQQAYEEALAKCNTELAPWHIVPSDRKWYRNLVVSELLRKTLEKLNPKVPPADPKLDGLVIE